jgi:hypothetical protein
MGLLGAEAAPRPYTSHKAFPNADRFFPANNVLLRQESTRRPRVRAGGPRAITCLAIAPCARSPNRTA